MRPPLKVRIYAIARFQPALIGGLVRRIVPKMIAMNGKEAVGVIMPAGVDDREARLAESLPDQSFDHPESYQFARLLRRAA
jgi:hypothetical protein